MTVAEAQKSISESEAKIHTCLSEYKSDISKMRDQTRAAADKDRLMNILIPYCVPVASVFIFILGIATVAFGIGVAFIIAGVLGFIIGIVVINKKTKKANLDYKSYKRVDEELGSVLESYKNI